MKKTEKTFQQEPTTKKVDKHSQVGIYTKNKIMHRHNDGDISEDFELCEWIRE